MSIVDKKGFLMFFMFLSLVVYASYMYTDIMFAFTVSALVLITMFGLYLGTHHHMKRVDEIILNILSAGLVIAMCMCLIAGMNGIALVVLLVLESVFVYMYKNCSN